MRRFTRTVGLILSSQIPGKQAIKFRKVAGVGLATFFLLGLGRPSLADDLPFSPRDGELQLGPISRIERLQNIVIESHISAFLSVQSEGSGVRLRARIVADLADLDHKISEVVSLLPLPKDNCARRGRENLVVRVRGSDLQVTGDQATIHIRGDLRAWLCLDQPFSSDPLKTHVSPLLPFKASLPLKLTTDGPTSVAVVFDRPALQFEESWGDVTDTVLTLAGVDVSSELERLLRQVIRPEELQIFLPEELLPLEPKITSARFFGNPESLAAEITMGVDLGALRLGEIWALSDP